MLAQELQLQADLYGLSLVTFAHQQAFVQLAEESIRMAKQPNAL